MNKITKENLNDFLDQYHGFHDSCISSINYLISNSQIEMIIDLYWEDKQIKKDEKSNKIKLIFNNIKQYSNKEIFSWDFIHSVYLGYVKLEDNEYICFADDEDHPLIYVVCESIMYGDKDSIQKPEKKIYALKLYFNDGTYDILKEKTEKPEDLYINFDGLMDWYEYEELPSKQLSVHEILETGIEVYKECSIDFYRLEIINLENGNIVDFIEI